MLNIANRYKKEEEVNNRYEEYAKKLNIIKNLKEEVAYLKKELEVIKEQKDKASNM